MFHSGGTVQSKTRVPVETSCKVSGMIRCRRFRVSRTPFPVILRQIGYSSAINACISCPRTSGAGLSCAGTVFTYAYLVSDNEVGVRLVTIDNYPFVCGPLNPKCWIIPTNSPHVFWGVKLRHLIEHFRIIFQRLKTMRESFWNVQHLFVFYG